ncbi:FHA domain-containing protein [Austwickia chelonae]|nr:DUF3662 and FHA domain-containing protein [Austwickia chelonae]SEW42237.1 FHA domain-containing protein [Austwickia chelonae]
MGLFDRVERKLESAVNGAFARAFRAEVQPVEIASAMRRAMDDRAAVVGRGRTVVPNLFVIDLSPSDYERLTSYADLLAEELIASVEEHAEQQHYVPGGPFHIDFRSREELETGVFRVRPATAKRIPDGELEEDPQEAAEMRRRQHAEELRRAHPFRSSEAEAPAEGSAGLASHAASAAAGSLASTAAAGRAGGADPYGQPHDPYAAQDPRRDPYADPDPRRDPYGQPHDPYAAQDPRRDPYDPYQAAAAAVPAAPAADRWPAQPPAGREAAYGGRDYDDYDRDPREAPAPPRPSAARVDPSERPWLDMDGHGYPLLSALTVLGRDPHVDITLEDAGISRRHAEIRVTHDGPHFAISVRDLGSTNGTFVNGDRITSQHVTDGDRITLGRTSLVIRSGRR